MTTKMAHERSFTANAFKSLWQAEKMSAASLGASLGGKHWVIFIKNSEQWKVFSWLSEVYKPQMQPHNNQNLLWPQQLLFVLTSH